MFKLTLILFFTIFSIHSNELQLSQDQINEFKKIMHYRPSFLGLRSEVDSPNFFLSKAGKSNLKEEILANIQSIQNSSYIHPVSNMSYQCTFPRRYEFFRAYLLKNLPPLKCIEYENWHSKFQANKVSLVFASYYPNNPSSLFGHTFLRLKADNSKISDLRDYIINFSAHTAESNGLAFAWNGLTGGYLGLFDIKPYYVKINEYTFNESRDLWEYELDLSPHELNYMLMHYWELFISKSHFNYYFLNENCSYFILALLETGKPSLKLTEYFYVYTLPSETAQKVSELNTQISFRPSIKTQLEFNYKNLNSVDKHQLNALLKSNVGARDVSSNVLDVAILHQRFHLYENKVSISTFLKGLLLEKSKRRDETRVQDLENTSTSAPHSIHLTTRQSLGFGIMHDSKNEEGFISYELKPGVHSFLDPPKGFPDRSTLEVLSFKLNYFKYRNSLKLENVNYLKLVSSELSTPIYQPISWQVNIYSERIYRDGTDSIDHVAKAGFGKTYSLFNWDHAFFTGAQLHFFDNLRRSWNTDVFFEYKNFKHFSGFSRLNFSVQYEFRLLKESLALNQQRLLTMLDFQYDFSKNFSFHFFAKSILGENTSPYNSQTGLNFVHRF